MTNPLVRTIVSVSLMAACTNKAPPSVPAASPASAVAAPAPEATAVAADPQAELMGIGLNALYQKGDAKAAIEPFRRVLSLNPTHYGAHYQLAVALERSGDVGAKDEWAKVLAAATEINDVATVKDAKTHLGLQ